MYLVKELFICLADNMFCHYLIVRKCTHSVYCLSGAAELYHQVIEIQLSELDGDGELGSSACDSP